MSTATPSDPGFGAEDAYLRDFAGFAALKTALQTGLLDRLLEAPAVRTEIASRHGLAEGGMAILLGMMHSAGLVVMEGEHVELVPGLRAVLLHRRTLLEQKVRFLDRAIRDVQDRLFDLLFDLPAFQRSSLTFDLFRYDRALDVTPGNLAETEPWVSYVTALTEAEAPLLVPEIDLGGARRLLEIGGNSGAFSEALLARHPELTAAVMDLPAVCVLGEERMRGRLLADRLRFVAGDARTLPWPGPVDAVVFKSFLHDWPDSEMRGFLERAAERLSPEGRIVICERMPFRPGLSPIPLSMLTNLVFAPFYRETDRYVAALRDVGLDDIRTATVELDLPFQIVTALVGP